MSLEVSNISFKGYVPVRYFAYYDKAGKYVPVLKKENIRKCNRFVVSNLNGTLKTGKNDEFVKYYKKYDSDYRKNNRVCSVYDIDKPVVYIVSGNDSDVVTRIGKEIGPVKREAIEKNGNTKTAEVKNVVWNYFKEVKNFLRNNCRRLKSQDNKNLELNVYFNPKYTRNNTLKKFEFEKAKFKETN